MPEVVLAHDYLVQVGGAERVVAEWAAGFGAHEVVTLAYRPESTYDAFRRLNVRATIPPSLATHVERMLPALPSIAARTVVSGGDVALVSSSGWAHRFRYEIPYVVYVHSPARWLYAVDDYRMRLSPVRRAGLAMSTPLLRRGDVDGMRKAGAVVANSQVTRDRILAAYGLDSIVVNPPVEPVAGRRVAFFSTAPTAIHDRLREHLEREHGAEVVLVSGSLADRSALLAELDSPEAARAEVYLTEIKAAAIDVVAETAETRGLPVVFADNEVLPLPGERDLDAEVVALADAAIAARAAV